MCKIRSMRVALYNSPDDIDALFLEEGIMHVKMELELDE